MIKHDHVWEKWTPDLASKLKLSIDFRSENGSDEFWVRWHTMLWFSTCPSLFPIGVYDTDKHYTSNDDAANICLLIFIILLNKQSSSSICFIGSIGFETIDSPSYKALPNYTLITSN